VRGAELIDSPSRCGHRAPARHELSIRLARSSTPDQQIYRFVGG
jgi:hypothetical protein